MERMYRNRRIQKNVEQASRLATEESICLRRHIYPHSKHYPSDAYYWVLARLQIVNQRECIHVV